MATGFDVLTVMIFFSRDVTISVRSKGFTLFFRFSSLNLSEEDFWSSFFIHSIAMFDARCEWMLLMI